MQKVLQFIYKKPQLILATCAILLLIIYNGLYAYEFWYTPDHYSYVTDALQSAEDPSFSPTSKSIFFHDTSHGGRLSARQACAVEAAARANPQRQVYVLFSSPVSHHTLKTTCLANLQELNNINLATLHILEYAKGTIAQPNLLNSLEVSKFPSQHSGEILRILTLNKWGGIYLDTDMVVVRPLESLPPNWIVRQGDKLVAPGIFQFAKDDVGSNLTRDILEEIMKTYNPYDWSLSSTRSIQRVLRRTCPELNSVESCRDVTILPNELFYPPHQNLWKLYFDGKTTLTSESPYTFHMWNFLNHRKTLIKHTPYKMLAKKYCPTVFEKNAQELGF